MLYIGTAASGDKPTIHSIPSTDSNVLESPNVIHRQRVAPAELEEILRSHPHIEDAAVVGIPDERSGEIPKAFVVPKEKKISEEEVKKFVAEKVSDYKHLKGGVEFISSIPKSPSGKILRRLLKERR
ncbi:hypothetical protein ANN_05936 [Periplaneta americana]|uniref:AMP-binding enzyme C-terminal domain-containing protein n=1 Tax=Periplaneta americana TaxID=6978 RepID=A0ABQ8TC60_PERAM|nr:hypothetical protein ANN_05936 [Periplaneta americana]